MQKILLIPILFFLFSNIVNADDLPFSKRFMYFDKSIYLDENFDLAKKVIMTSKKLGFNGFVLNEDYIYTRLSHKNAAIDKSKQHIKSLEELTHSLGMEFIVMHFAENMANEVVHDSDSNNKFYQNGKFDFSESTKLDSIYTVENQKAIFNPEEKIQTQKKGQYYHFTDIDPSKEYAIIADISTNNYKSKKIKVSVLDEDYSGEHGKVIFGVTKFFTNVKKNQSHGIYKIYFNSLDHPNSENKIKVYIAKNKRITIHSVTIKEIGFKKSINVVQPSHKVLVSSEINNTIYSSGIDYNWDENDSLVLLSDKIKNEKRLKVTWYPRIDTSTIKGQLDTADACADTSLYFDIIKDQYKSIEDLLQGNIDAVAFNDDEWREAGWNQKCKDIYSLEYNSTDSDGVFSGGDYIGITTQRTIDTIIKNALNPNLEFYLMSDMFDPNFNGTNPYMGVHNGALGAIDYLDPNKVVFFNWFFNPFEPGLEKKTLDDFKNSAKYFSDKGFRQIIAGYHDDLKNLDANIATYKESPKDVQDSIIGFMFLIWHQPGKNATYDDINKTVAKICKEIPNKWVKEGCDALISLKAPSNLTFSDINQTSVVLHWVDNSDNEDGFKIFRDEKLIFVTDKNVTSYKDTGLEPSHTYKYTIKATKKSL